MDEFYKNGILGDISEIKIPKSIDDYTKEELIKYYKEQYESYLELYRKENEKNNKLNKKYLKIYKMLKKIHE